MSDSKMRHELKFTAFLLVISLFASAGVALARTWTPGVRAGDYFYYEMYGVYTSNTPNVTLSIPQFEYNNTEWARINITKVEGSIIHQIYTLRFVNGSETSFDFKTDVNPANESSLQFYERGVPICAKNLNPGDYIPTAEITLNETVFRVYGSGPRETTHAVWNSSGDWGDCYFDRETGMLVALSRTHVFVSNSSDEVVWKTDVVKMTDSSRWQIDTRPLITALIVLTVTFLVFLSIAVVTYRFAARKQLNAQLVLNR